MMFSLLDKLPTILGAIKHQYRPKCEAVIRTDRRTIGEDLTPKPLKIDC